MKKISVIIPSFNEQENISQTLQSLISQNNSQIKEIIVVDGQSTDETVSIVRRYSKKNPFIKLIQAKKRGIGYQRQVGFKAAANEIIASTDADCIIPSNWSIKISRRFTNQQTIIGLVGPIKYTSKPLIFNVISTVTIIISDYLHFLVLGFPPFRGTNFAIISQAWNDSSGFNTNLNALEDVEFSLRFSKKGKISYDPSLVVSTSPRRLNHQFFLQSYKRLRAYYYRVIKKDDTKFTEWDIIR